jgi:RHS repeat-associated protein
MDLDGSDATVARYTLAPFGYGDLLSQRRGNATSFYHFDALGSTRALTESDEDISDTYLYDAWGVLKASTGSTTNPYRYVGKLGYLSEAALDGYLLRRRYYRQAGGRFVSVDPLRSRSGASDDPAYAYCEGRPAALVDPGGYAVDFRGCGPEKEASVNRWCERLRAIPQDEMNQIRHCIDQHTRAHKIPSCYPFTESVANTFRRFCDRGRLTCESRGCGDCKPEQGEPICGAQDFGYNYCKISLCFPEVGSPNKCGNPFDPRIPPLEDAFLHELAHCAGIQGDGDRQDLCNEIHAKCLWRVLA